jgi:endonuclease YncB( thermonuclease family)
VDRRQEKPVIALPSVPVPFQFNAWVDEWTDGDTVVCRVDRGDRDYSTWNVRVLGASCRETPKPRFGIKGEPGGLECQAEVTRRWPPGTALTLATVKPDKYGGRHLGLVVAAGPDGPVNVADELVRDQWAARWNGKGKAPKPPWPRTIQ